MTSASPQNHSECVQPELATLAPVKDSDRIISLDIIRALALFGVLLIHFSIFSGEHARDPFNGGLGWVDRLVDDSTQIFVRGKSISCFSMLFGIGLFIQFERAAAKNITILSYAMRRLGALFVLGMLHYILVWNGDVLGTYALLGFFLLPFTKTKPWTFVVSAVGVFCFVAFLPFIIQWLHLDPRWSIYAWKGPSIKAMNALASHGSALASFKGSVLHLTSRLLDEAGTILPLFIVGALLWRSGLPRDPVRHGLLLKRIFHGSFWLGLMICILTSDALALMPEALKRTGYGTLWTGLQNFGTAVLALGYFSGLLRLLALPSWSRRLSIIAPLGRMALTNYIAHSVILILVFNAWFHLEGKLRPGLSLLMVILLYSLQVAWSHWWLHYFRFGPLEWVWRCMTYWKLQPMRHGPRVPAPSGKTVVA